MASQPVPPLSLDTVKLRYPRLYREYNFFSDREKEGNSDAAVSNANGLCTTISFVDFTKPLEDHGDCPMKTESDANKFCMFVWKILNACESGSIGGDACRQFDVLNNALDDSLAMHSIAARFEHLLGWTAAATNHGLHALLYRGDPDRNRSLFKAVGDEWKKIFEANTEVVVSEELRKFAIWMCESFQKLLKEAKKEYGDYAKYTFNFIKKPRVQKAVASAAAPTKVGTNQQENATPAADDEPKPWEEENFVPMRGGKQKSPNMIRNELQKHIDQSKADGTMTQTRIIEQMGVNNNTFRRFMNPKTYKDQWSAVQNGTYWAAARLLAEAKYENDKAKKSGAKRKTASDDNSAKKTKVANSLSNDIAASSSNDGGSTAVASSKTTRAEATELIHRINAVEGVPDNIVHDTCPQLVTKIKDFLQREGMTKANRLKALGDINNNSLTRFLSGKKQDQCATVTYKAGYVFFEKLRILEGRKKSSARLKNEQEHVTGFSLTKNRGGLVYCAFI